MRVLFFRLRLLLVLSLGAVWLVAPARGQVADVRTVEERADGVVMEVQAAWPRTLRAGLDSLGAASLTAETLQGLMGGLFQAAAMIELPGPAHPRVQVLAADFDEVVLPAGAGADSLRARLARPLAEVVGLGTQRKRTAATLTTRLWEYDGDRLRRYRRILVQVTYPGAAAKTAAGRGSLLAAAECSASSPHLSVPRSVLADGVVFKIPVTGEGLYRIDRATLSRMLSGAGLSINGLQAGQIKLYGNGGRPLPALNGAPRPADLVENPIFVRTDGGGFAELFFYGSGPTGWTYDAQAGAWRHYVHPFSNENYYFLKIDPAAGDGKRVGEGTFPAYPDATVLNQVTGRAFRDFDDVMWSKEGEGSGHTWVSKQIRSFERLEVLTGVAFPGLTGGRVQYRARVAVHANPSAAVYFSSGTTRLGEVVAPSISRIEDSAIAHAVEAAFEQTVADGQGLSVTMTLQERINDPQAAMDWIRVFYPQALRAENGYLRFVTPAGTAGRLEMSLRGFTQAPQVWDVTDPGSIRRLGVVQRGDAYHVQVEVADPAAPRELVAFTDAAVRPAEAAVRVAPQNLHGIASHPEFVIVTPDTFRVHAEELAEHRRRDGLVVEVVDIRQIYNEFSGGLQDMRAVRDYFKFLYDRCVNGEPSLRYALLFGDGHFNYRNIPSERPTLENWIPPYETEDSFHPMASFTSDDYFGLLDDDEGRWPYLTEYTPSSERLDLGIGRIPVQDARTAAAVVRKIKHYEHVATYGPWRTRYTFVADDGFTGLGAQPESIRDLHVQNADVVAEMVRTLHPEINVQKIYAPSYDRVFSTIYKIPGARRDILAAIHNGVLLLNYSGHGGEEGLAQEEIFTKEDAAELENFDKLTVFVTATCSFGRWDMADEQSAGEVLLLNHHGGAVALLTTVRTVYTSPDIYSLNVGLNRELNRALLQREPGGLPRRLGDALREAKNTRAGLEGNNRKFNLLGDPAMRLGLPVHHAVVTSVNGRPVAEQPAPLRALDRTTVRGEIRTPGGGVDEGFDGLVHLTIYDAARRVRLPYRNVMPTDHYVVREDLIWRGEVKAAQGRFEATFVVPKDISYSNEAGRIAVYARSEAQHALGFTENVVVGGSSDNPVVDHQGPEIALFLNDTTFVSGGLTTGQPQLLVKLFDESGINTVGAGVGHEMLLVIDGDEQNAVNISAHYESEPDSYQRGRVTFALTEYLRRKEAEAFEPGPHTLVVKAWDVMNNATTATLDFFVAEDARLALRNVFNYPNPMVGETRFVFEHNQPQGTPARLQIRIYTLAGQPVRTLDADEALPAGVLPGGPVQVPWDGRDEDFDPLAPGVYLYKVRLEVEQPGGDRQVSEHIEKLAILR